MNIPPYPSYPNILLGNIKLRKIQPEDLDTLLPICFYNAIQAKSIDEALKMNDLIHADYLNGDSIHWVIEDTTNHFITGTCGYYRGFAESSGELGCVLLPMHRGKGYMTKAMQTAIAFGFEYIGLNRIWAQTDISNNKAITLLERLHFTKVGGPNQNEVTFQIFKSQYELPSPQDVRFLF